MGLLRRISSWSSLDLRLRGSTDQLQSDKCVEVVDLEDFVAYSHGMAGSEEEITDADSGYSSSTDSTEMAAAAIAALLSGPRCTSRARPLPPRLSTLSEKAPLGSGESRHMNASQGTVNVTIVCPVTSTLSRSEPVAPHNEISKTSPPLAEEYSKSRRASLKPESAEVPIPCLRRAGCHGDRRRSSSLRTPRDSATMLSSNSSPGLGRTRRSSVPEGSNLRTSRSTDALNDLSRAQELSACLGRLDSNDKNCRVGDCEHEDAETATARASNQTFSYAVFWFELAHKLDRIAKKRTVWGSGSLHSPLTRRRCSSGSEIIEFLAPYLRDHPLFSKRADTIDHTKARRLANKLLEQGILQPLHSQSDSATESPSSNRIRDNRYYTVSTRSLGLAGANEIDGLGDENTSSVSLGLPARPRDCDLRSPLGLRCVRDEAKRDFSSSCDNIAIVG